MPRTREELEAISEVIDPWIDKILSTLSLKTKDGFSKAIKITIENNSADESSAILKDDGNSMSKKDFRDFEALFHSIIFYAKRFAEVEEHRISFSDNSALDDQTNCTIIKEEDLAFLCDLKNCDFLDEAASGVLFEFTEERAPDIEEDAPDASVQRSEAKVVIKKANPQEREWL